MKKVSLDFADLGMALDDHDQMFASFLDTETGEVLPYSEYDPEEEDDELRERIDANEEGRYLGIDPIPSHEGFRFMEDFIDTLPDGPARSALFDALDRPRPFRRFKDALHAFPDVRERWYAYRRSARRSGFAITCSLTTSSSNGARRRHPRPREAAGRRRPQRQPASAFHRPERGVNPRMKPGANAREPRDR